MRAFIAISLPKEIQDALARLQDKLKACGADVKWVEPNNIHLTLKFLGDIDVQKLDKIISILENVCKDKNCFRISLVSIGAFPKISSPRIIWLGVKQGEKEAKEIFKDLEEKIEKLGIPKEDRAFSAHITIGRTRSALNLDKLAQNLQALTDDFKIYDSEFEVKNIALFKSILTPKGPIYEVLKEANLKTS